MIKKAIGLFLSLVLCMSVLTVAFAAENEKDLPVIYLSGSGSALKTKNGEQLYPPVIEPKKILEDNLANLLDKLSSGFITEDWTDFGNLLMDIIDNELKDLRYNNDGTAVDEFYVENMNDLNAVKNRKKLSGYSLHDYDFGFDWRDDPTDIAKSLDKYIDAVLEGTKKSQVIIYAFSFGSCVLAAYLDQFGSGKIDSVVLHSPAVNGVISAGSALSGNLRITADSIDSFVNNYQSTGYFLDDIGLGGLVGVLVTIFNKINALGYAVKSLDKFYANIEDIVNSRLGISSVATFPGIWAMVGDEYYEDAKEVSFGDKGGAYDKLIEKIDNYHYTVAVNAYNIFEAFKSEGKNISIIAKYGVAQIPIFKDCEKQSDSVIATAAQSFGATCADMNCVLSDEYIRNAEYMHTEKFISPDKVIDASTCLFPQYTWFIRDISHTKDRAVVDKFIAVLCKKTSQPTVDDTDTLERFSIFDSKTKTIEALTDNDKISVPAKSWTEILIKFIKAFISFLSKAAKKIL